MQRRWIGAIAMALVGTSSIACNGGDDDGGQLAEDGTSSGSMEEESDGDGSSGATTSGAGTTTSGATEDTSGTSGAGSSEGTETTGGDASEFGVLVRGPLFTSDLAEAQTYHDMLAMGAAAQANRLGDFGHDVVLGTTLLGTTENEFVAVDRWTNLDGALGLYGDPDFQQAFGMLFAEPVMPALFERRTDWHIWGDLDAADDADEHFLVVVRGHLAAEDVADSQTLHDQLATAGEATAMQLGDVAHEVWLGVDDPREFFAVDVWTSSADIETFYGNPDLQAGFAMLFDAPPSVGVYRSTAWYQW